jgi:hypothetical protein
MSDMADFVNDVTLREDDYGYIECPCCGCEAGHGNVEDGQPLLCGCAGHISVDSESEPCVFVDDCLPEGGKP